MRVGGQCHVPVALPPGKTQYPQYRRLGGSQGRSGWVQKMLPPTRIRSPDRPARSELLYRLLYPSPHNIHRSNKLCFWLSKRHLSVNFAWISQVLFTDGRKWKFIWLLCSPSMTQMLPATFRQRATKWMHTVAASSSNNSASLVDLLFDPHSEAHGQHVRSFELSCVQNWFFWS